MFSQRVNKSQKGTRHVAGRDAEIMGHERVNKVCHVPQQLNRMSLYIQTPPARKNIYKPLITDVSDRGNC